MKFPGSFQIFLCPLIGSGVSHREPLIYITDDGCTKLSSFSSREKLLYIRLCLLVLPRWEPLIYITGNRHTKLIQHQWKRYRITSVLVYFAGINNVPAIVSFLLKNNSPVRPAACLPVKCLQCPIWQCNWNELYDISHGWVFTQFISESVWHSPRLTEHRVTDNQYIDVLMAFVHVLFELFIYLNYISRGRWNIYVRTCSLY